MEETACVVLGTEERPEWLEYIDAKEEKYELRSESKPGPEQADSWGLWLGDWI